MSDPNKFINTYIDVAMATIHEQLSSGLQLKTQLRLTNDVIAEKDRVIASLNTEIENLKKQSEELQQAKNNDNTQLNSELEQARNNARVWEESHNVMKNKVAHMDTLLKQVVDMKHEIQTRDATIQSLKSEIEELKEPKAKPTIKKKASDKNLLNTISILEETSKIDDF